MTTIEDEKGYEVAEKYLRKKYGDDYVDFLETEGQSYLDGYEQGYEDCRHYAHDYYKPKWHDLRKVPNDLPEEDGEYWSNIGLVVFEYTDSKHSWFTPLCEACDDQEDVSDEVIAWYKLPKFKE